MTLVSGSNDDHLFCTFNLFTFSALIKVDLISTALYVMHSFNGFLKKPFVVFFHHHCLLVFNHMFSFYCDFLLLLHDGVSVVPPATWIWLLEFVEGRGQFSLIWSCCCCEQMWHCTGDGWWGGISCHRLKEFSPAKQNKLLTFDTVTHESCGSWTPLTQHVSCVSFIYLETLKWRKPPWL